MVCASKQYLTVEAMASENEKISIIFSCLEHTGDMENTKSFVQIMTNLVQAVTSLRAEIAEIRQEVVQVRQENAQLDRLLSTALAHIKVCSKEVAEKNAAANSMRETRRSVREWEKNR